MIHRSKESLLSIYLCLFVAEMHYSMSQCQQREVVRVHASSLTSLTTHEAACCLLLTKINAKIKRKTGNNKEISAIGSFRMFVLKWMAKLPLHHTDKGSKYTLQSIVFCWKTGFVKFTASSSGLMSYTCNIETFFADCQYSVSIMSNTLVNYIILNMHHANNTTMFCSVLVSVQSYHFKAGTNIG